MHPNVSHARKHPAIQGTTHPTTPLKGEGDSLESLLSSRGFLAPIYSTVICFPFFSPLFSLLRVLRPPVPTHGRGTEGWCGGGIQADMYPPAANQRVELGAEGGAGAGGGRRSQAVLGVIIHFIIGIGLGRAEALIVHFLLLGLVLPSN